jgi:hypothetical protein
MSWVAQQVVRQLFGRPVRLQHLDGDGHWHFETALDVHVPLMLGVLTCSVHAAHDDILMPFRGYGDSHGTREPQAIDAGEALAVG